MESEGTCKSTAEEKYQSVLHHYGKWHEKKWYFCKYGGGCGDDVHFTYRIMDGYDYERSQIGTKAVIWGIRIF